MTDARQAPDKAGLVLLSLILVAAVANLNLSVANVALPDIGAAFSASQTALDLVAVGYSLGLAASVLWLGALGDRYGRKLMLILGVLLSIPACLLAAFAPTIEVLIVARIVGGVSAGMAYPDDAGPHRRAVVGPRTDPVDRPLVGARRRDRVARAARVRVPPRAIRVGLGLPRHPPARSRRARHGHPLRAGPRQRDDREGRQPGRDPVGRAGRGGDPRHQLRAGAERGAPRARPVRHRDRRRGRVRHSPATRRQPAVRPEDRLAPRVLGRRCGRDHRLRLADGRDVHRPAVPPERAGLLDP